MDRTFSWLAPVLAALLAAAPSLARGQGGATRAGLLHFNAASDAWRDGKFDLAAREFEAAYELDHLTELLYNIARSRHNQYLLAPDAPTLKVAIAAYRRYVAEAPAGRHRNEAIQALDELVVIDFRLTPPPAPAPKPPPSGGKAPVDDEENEPPPSPQSPPKPKPVVTPLPPPVIAAPPIVEPYVVRAPEKRRWITPVVVVSSVAVVGLALGLGLGLGLHGQGDTSSLGKVSTPW